MSIENTKTLDVYKNTAHLYLINSVEHDKTDPVKAQKKREALENFIKDSLSSIPQHSKVLEIGSADGTNAKYIESLGYNVIASDTIDTFIEALMGKGLKAIKYKCFRR